TTFTTFSPHSCKTSARASEASSPPSRGATMTNSRLAIVGLATGMLLAATPALAGNGHATPSASVDQLGPKNLPCTRNAPKQTLTATTGGNQIPLRALCEDELGPKYLLSHC